MNTAQISSGASAIYPGSFDPWSVGHQYVMDSALKVFSQIYVLLALNPAKQGGLNTLTRLRLIAHSIDPIVDWFSLRPPFHIENRIHVTFTEGLVVDFARAQNIEHLVRGLRSTSDFEAEFNLYFSNKAIFEGIETWAIMCPPNLLHCSSSYVRTVIGKPGVPFVGTSFLAQAMFLGLPPFLGEALDAISLLSKNRFESRFQDIPFSNLATKLQIFFTNTAAYHKEMVLALPDKFRTQFWADLSQNRDELKKDLLHGRYPEEFVAKIWALIVQAFCAAPGLTEERRHFSSSEHCLEFFALELGSMGKGGVSVVPTEQIRSFL